MNREKFIPFGIGAAVLLILCIGGISAIYLIYLLFNRADNIPFIDTSPPTLPSIEETKPTEEFTPSPSPETPIRSDVGLEELFSPFWESWELLHEYFVEQPIDNQVLADGAIEGLTSFLEQEEVDILEVTIPDSAVSIEAFAEEANTPAEVLLEFLPFWELWQKIEYAELPEDMTYEMRMRNSLAGMASALDDSYTSYLDPDQFRQLEIDLQGEYEGIGAWVDPSADYLTIISPMEGSPAEEAGLLPGDRVVAVDGEDMTGVNGNLVIGKVLGPAGTKVVLTIEREGVDEPFDVEIIRAHITLPNVESEILEGNIAYVKLFMFGDDSHEDIRDALIEVLDENPVGLILDLRGNGGGWLDVAIDITSEFIQEGVLLYQESGDGSREIHEARTFNGLATEIPLVVLVDGGSASASEILAGAVQDYERGVLVGTTTFGKGSVQRAYPLSNDQGSLRITTDKWLTPNERHIQGLGLEPDYVVEITEEDIEADYDPQLEKAIELLITN